MGSYTFKWEHPADEVYVTGTFDDWGKTVKLEKGADGVFTKTVELPATQENVYYKFVKDGEWVTSHTAPTETDSSGNTNNVLKPTDFVSSAAPASTTAALAGAVPKTGAAAGSTPGAFPETPAAAAESGEPKDFSVNPIPASAGLGNPIDLKPGEKVPDPSTFNSNTIQSGVHDDLPPKLQGDPSFVVAPIPATAGLGNPIDLKPGEKVPDPSTFTSNTVNSTVKTDQASYEKSDAYPTDGTGDQSKKLDAAGDAFSVPPPVASNLIPESSLPIGQGASAKDADPGVTIQSAAPASTTAALAGLVPKEPTSGSAAISSAAPGSSTAAMAGQVPKEGAAAAAVPEEVKESQKEAGVGPEASANLEAVQEKAAVEQELLKEVKPDNSAGEPAPTESAAAASTAPAPTTGAAAAGALQPPAAAAAETSTAAAAGGPSATTGVATAAVPEKSLPETPKKDAGGSVGRRMSGAFKKVMGESSAAGSPSAATPASAKTEASPASTPGTGAKGHKKKQSIFKKLKEAFK